MPADENSGSPTGLEWRRWLEWLVSKTTLILLLLAALAVYFTLTHQAFVLHCFTAASHRVTATNLPQIISAVAWPLSVLISVILLRKALLGLLNRIEKLIWGDKSLSFGQVGFSSFEKKKDQPALLRRWLPPLVPLPTRPLMRQRLRASFGQAVI
jgi:hypothetical protein